ncbi:MAG: tRNA (adenosine(37)-N6)-threonylcarbamoyltransferase complex dimerization subunit type 1 TsaB [Phycisphaerales bacterium]|nr:tRNA (adenosine(37)-N6)-threonylcarbamoyltransferase complex dimerization subunit type 1 TsaB [Phycisphaerales bacterium]
MPHLTMLAIETSQRRGEVALREASGRVHEEALATRDRHDDDLLPAIDRVCARAGVRALDLEAVAVSVGPGGFTGLRIAVATAKGLAEAIGARLVAVPSALVAAASIAPPAARAHVILASKGESCWLTTVVRTGARWTIEGEPGLVDAGAIALDGIDVVCGDRFTPEALRARCDAGAVPLVEPVFGAAACLAEASARWSAGVVTDALRLSPVYAREPEAVTLWRLRHGIQ